MFPGLTSSYVFMDNSDALEVVYGGVKYQIQIGHIKGKCPTHFIIALAF